MSEEASSSSSVFSLKNTRPPDDTVFYAIYPDSSTSADELGSLHRRILDLLHPLIAPYIWQHQPFTLSLSSSPPIPHLCGHLHFGDNLEDEWFVVYLMFLISRTFHNLSIPVCDSDGEFLLIESAFHLTKWPNPDTSLNRVFIRRGLLHVIPKSLFPATPDLEDSFPFRVMFLLSFFLISRNLEDLDFDADQFMKHIESVIGLHGSTDDGSDVDLEEESTSDLDFDDYDEDSDHSEDIEDDGDHGFLYGCPEPGTESHNTEQNFCSCKGTVFKKER